MLFFGILVLSLLTTIDLVARSARRQPKGTNGSYTVHVRGASEGTGRAEVAGGQVNIHASVTDESGAKGTLSASNLVLSGPQFSGTGTVMGRPATFTGRLDGYSGDSHFERARLLCSFTDNAGRSGRVAGVLD